MERGYIDGLKKAEDLARQITDNLWNEEFARHGNKGLATMKQKLGIRIESAIRAYREDAEESRP